VNAVILGSSGFVGRALERHLATTGVAVRGFSSATLDLTRAEALPLLDAVVGPETVLYVLASLTPDRGATPRTMCQNLAMAANLAAHLEATSRRPAKIVLASTDAVYPAHADRVDESTPTLPEGYYGVGKLAAEGALRAATRATGTPLLILRPTGLFGAGDPHGSYGPNRFVKSAIVDRKVKLFGDGEELRDHLFLADFVRVLAELPRTAADGVVNVASGASRSFASIVEELRAIVPFELDLARLPRSGAVTHRRYDISLLRRLLPGFEPSPFGESLRATFEGQTKLHAA